MTMKQQYPVHVYGTMNCIALCAGIFLPTVHHWRNLMFIFLNRYTFVFVNLQHKLNLFSQFCHYLRKCNELLFLNYKQKNVCSKYENLQMIKWEKTTSQCDQTNALVYTSIVLTKCICIKCFFRSPNTPKLIRNHCVKCCNMIIAIWFFKIIYQNWTRKSWLKIKFICFDLIFYF